MEWWFYLIVLLAGFLVLLAIGLPIAYAFSLVNIIVLFFFFGAKEPAIAGAQRSHQRGPVHLPAGALFILMGEVIFRTGLSKIIFDTIDLLTGRVRGRLAVVTTVGGIILAPSPGPVPPLRPP